MNWLLLLLLAGLTLVVALMTLLILAVLSLAAQGGPEIDERESAPERTNPVSPSPVERDVLQKPAPAASVSRPSSDSEFPSRAVRGGFWPQPPQPHGECAIEPATALHHASMVKL